MNALNEFLALADNVYLVEGAAAAALYDLRERKVWSVPGPFVRALDSCSDGLPFSAALARTLGKDVAPDKPALLRHFVDEHPALEWVKAIPRKPSPPPLSRTVQPSWLMLEITETCNLYCPHCYVSCALAPDSSAGPTLPTSRWLELLEEAREIGFRSLQLTGGEPTLHPDLPTLLRAAYRLGYQPVALFTNLIALGDDLFALVCEIEAQVHSSIYSHNAGIHDSITRQAGSFDRTVEGLRRVLAAGLETYVSVVLMEENTLTRDKTLAFLETLGVAADHVKLGCVRPQGRGANLPPPKVPSFWPRRFHEWTVENDTHLVANTCWAGRTAIAANGDVYVCVGERIALGRVAAAPLRAVVEGPAMRELWRITLEDVPECAQCEFRYSCFDCRADVHLLTGELLGRDPTCPYDPQTGQCRYEGVTMSDQPRRKDGLLTEDMNGDLIVADFSNTQMHVLSPVAAVIWELCDGRRTAEAMAGLLADHFGKPLRELHDDVNRILGEFRAKGLIE